MRGLLDKILRAREVLVAAGGARKVEMVRDLDANPAVRMARHRPSVYHRRLVDPPERDRKEEFANKG
jgi:hypothetical protein